MLTIVISVLLAFGLIAAGWYVFEHRWDLSLFGHHSEKDFTCNVRAGKAAQLQHEHPDLQVIDVRPGPSYTAEHLPGAINAPFLGTSLDTTSLTGVPRDQPILVYCDGGYRSRRSLPALREAGFTSIYHLHRGLMSWKIANEPTESGSAT